MKTLRIAVLSLVMFSGFSLAESTSLNTVKEYMAAWNAHDASRAAQYLLMMRSIMMPLRANQ